MLLAQYRSRIARGKLKTDDGQAEIARRLGALAKELATYQRPPSRGLLSRLRGNNGRALAPRSLYIWGDVGRGKTMLMDMFAETAPVEAKWRVHFHAFMQDVHARIFKVRKAQREGDAVAQVASAIGAELVLLCLDEMQVSDIADAMILGRLFEGLLANGTVIVTTANVPPDGLYRDGLNRQLFLPFVRLLEKHFDIVSPKGARDYRLGRVKAHETYITPLGPSADAKLQAIWEDLTDTERGSPAQIEVNGRQLTVPEAARDCVRYSFPQLCEAPLGAADFLALARSYRTFFVERVPRLRREQRNEMKRLIIFIDTLYDAHARLVISSDGEPIEIFPAKGGPPEVARAVSRLAEMQSAAWWDATAPEMAASQSKE
jgi:cell division protein ZapE